MKTRGFQVPWQATVASQVISAVGKRGRIANKGRVSAMNPLFILFLITPWRTLTRAALSRCGAEKQIPAGRSFTSCAFCLS